MQECRKYEKDVAAEWFLKNKWFETGPEGRPENRVDRSN